MIQTGDKEDPCARSLHGVNQCWRVPGERAGLRAQRISEFGHPRGQKMIRFIAE